MGEVKHTPGPWGWFGNGKTNDVYLATKHSGRRYVMGFRRWGMRGAQPMFQPGNRGLVTADTLFTFEVGSREVRGVEQAKADDSVYRLDINGIDCADAHLIAAAPDLYEAVEALLVSHRQGVGQCCAAADKGLAAIARARGEA
jgi:hypothetical protein